MLRAVPCLLWLAIAIAAAQAGTEAGATDWPQWRGPTGLGYSEDKDLPLHWDAKSGENILWKTPLPKSDTAQSSPIVWRDKVVVTTSTNKPPEHRVTCYGMADGKQLWETVVPPGPWILTDLRGGYACSTPATDGQRVYAVFGSAVIVALNLSDGSLAWRNEISPRAFDVAISSSPLLYKDTVILLCDQTGKTSFIIAYEAASGKTRWEEKRPTVGFNHSTPVIAQVGGKPQMFISASNALQGVDPANGKLLWWCASKGDVSTPAFGGNLVYTDEGRGGPGICVDPTGTGEVGKTHLKWSIKTGTNGFNSPIILGERLYRISASLRCYKLDTGEEVWAERLGGDFSPSPVATADGRLYYASAGPSWVIKPGDKFELLGKSDLGEPGAASPAVSDGRMILKGSKTLFCIGKK